jgi:hypothetical protein
MKSMTSDDPIDPGTGAATRHTLAWLLYIHNHAPIQNPTLNQLLVVTHLAIYAPSRQRDIVIRTGLSSSTVSRIMIELHSLGLVEEGEEGWQLSESMQEVRRKMYMILNGL